MKREKSCAGSRENEKKDFLKKIQSEKNGGVLTLEHG